MTTFNPGDRVRLSIAADPERRRIVGKAEGTVRKRTSFYGSDDISRVTVNWDAGGLENYNYPAASEIEHVPAAEPTVIDPELRERALALALKVSDFGSDADSIIAAARAFEAYILGDTK